MDEGAWEMGGMTTGTPRDRDLLQPRRDGSENDAAL